MACQIRPWAREHSELIEWGYDPTGDTGEQTDINRTAKKVIDEMLGGYGQPGAIRWDDRKNAFLPPLAGVTAHYLSDTLHRRSPARVGV